MMQERRIHKGRQTSQVQMGHPVQQDLLERKVILGMMVLRANEANLARKDLEVKRDRQGLQEAKAILVHLGPQVHQENQVKTANQESPGPLDHRENVLSAHQEEVCR